MVHEAAGIRRHDQTMASLKRSIRARLTVIITVFVLMLLTLGAIATAGLLSLDQKVEANDRKWLVGTRLLGELSDQLSEFRMAETFRALSADTESLTVAEALAEGHRKAISDLQDDYAAHLGADDHVGDLESVRRAVQAYLDAHDAWVSRGPGGEVGDKALINSPLHRLYQSADASIDRLIDATQLRSQAESASSEWIVDTTIAAVLIFLAVGIVLGGWLLIRVRRNIVQPLSSISGALTQLANGDREVRIPELDRQDEIGALAKSFDAFRATVLALEEAHEATRAAQEQTQAQARHDPLTGLPNRRVFFAELQAAIARSQGGLVAHSVLLVDLDHFKAVNDLQGHSEGDLVLVEVAQRLLEVVRKTDRVTRLGGDEFAIIAEFASHESADAIISLASRVIAAIRKPIATSNGNRVEIDASVGIASCVDDGTDATEILRAADIAMYRAKRDGRGTFRFFEQKMDEELREQINFEADLRKAVADGQIEPYYQPLIDMRNDQIYGFEILSRWKRPGRGTVFPTLFIPVAERLGLIPELTWSVLRQACRDAVRWGPDMRLSLNISPIQLRDPQLADDVLAILSEEHFPPSRLEVELTESALVRDIATARSVIAALQGAGVQVSLDDFGTGYSSLYHLRELRFDKVKIDASFVRSVEINCESEKIVDAIMGLARSLGLPTVAEGIENPSVLHHLSERGCEYGQGYYFGNAMAAGDIDRIMDRELELVAS